jgi:uncharacterized membrane protein
MLLRSMEDGMESERNYGRALEQIPADRRLVEALFGQGLIDRAARDHALQLLYPHKSWGLWISRLLLVTGASLVLAGFLYFFAFNWAKITPAIKLGSVQLAILACLAAAYVYGLERLSGKIALLSASVLLGGFLAVFGQIYQTGADSYTLFMMWSLLIAGWVVIAEFAPLWAVWLVVTNLFLVLWWDQAAQPDAGMELLIASILAAFNLTFLGLREYFAHRGAAWIAERWTRLILVIAVLGCLLVPTISYIFEPGAASWSVRLGALFGVAAHAALFALYRHRLPDIWPLSAALLSSCIIIEVAAIKLLAEIFGHNAQAPLLFFTGLITIGIFTFAIAALRVIASQMEPSHVR